MESNGWMQFLKDDDNSDDDEDQEFQHSTNSIGVTIPNLSILIHACLGTSIGMFVRLLKHNIDTETGTARPLISDKLQKTLGRVVCERATPFPSRTFDTTTLFLITSFPQWLTRHVVNGLVVDACTLDVRSRPAFTAFTGKSVGDLLFGVVFCRTTGRVNALHTLAMHLQAEKKTNRKYPSLPELSDLNLVLSYLHGTCIEHNSTSLASAWTTTQFKVPEAFRHFAPFREFLSSISDNALSVASELIEISSIAQLHPDMDTRNKAVLAVKSLLDITLEQMDRKRTMFFAAQIISDLEEFWDSPFGSVKTVHPGSGATWFLGAYRRGLSPIEKKTEVTSDMMICEKIVRELQECSDLELACLGYYVDAVDDGSIRNKLNHRLITANDGEHKACKGGIRITRTLPAYRISRRIAPTQPSFHPIHCDIEWPPAVYDIAHDAVHAFDQLVIKNKWPQLHELFLTGFEKKHKIEQSGVGAGVVGAGVCLGLGSSIGAGVVGAGVGGSGLGSGVGSGIGAGVVGVGIGSCVGSGVGSGVGVGVSSSVGEGVVGAGVSSGVGSGVGAGVVGVGVGSCIGSGVGSGVGVGVGSSVGEGVIGAGVSTGVGSGVGAVVGSGVGAGVGSSVGAGVVGAGVGSGVCSGVGSGVGAGVVGAGVGSCVGSGVGSGVGAGVCSGIGAGVVGAGVGSGVGSGVGAGVIGAGVGWGVGSGVGVEVVWAGVGSGIGSGKRLRLHCDNIEEI
jgi:hypothetical protein